MNEKVWGNGLYAVLNEHDELVGELSVQFFDQEEVNMQFSPSEQRVLWLGWGLKPALNGKGNGAEFTRSCVEYAIAQHHYQGEYVGLGVYLFNERAIRAYQKVGFEIYHSETCPVHGLEAMYMRKRVSLTV